jgi:hypothetical protein
VPVLEDIAQLVVVRRGACRSIVKSDQRPRLDAARPLPELDYLPVGAALSAEVAADGPGIAHERGSELSRAQSAHAPSEIELLCELVVRSRS